MATHVEPIARIRLARSMPRLLAAPGMLSAAGAAAIAAGLVAIGGTLGLVLAVLGATVVVGAIAGALVLLSIRFEVEEAAVGVSWLGGGRVYPLTAGPVTRVRLRGPSASRLRARTGALGWAVGRALLRGTERIEVVRLAPSATVILIPTERGRLAVAPARDDELLDALSRAARARARLEALAAAAAVSTPVEPSPVDVAPVEPTPDTAPPETAMPRQLTGIERAMLERGLADDAAAAIAPVEAPRPEPEPAMPAPPALADGVAATTAEVAAPSVQPRPARRRRIQVARPRPALALVLLPLIGAGAAWGVGSLTGRMPEPGSDLARLTSLALVMAGPATSIGALMALSWWPRLVGVVVAGGLAASVFIGRALIGA